jgi:hypothetical protein
MPMGRLPTLGTFSKDLPAGSGLRGQSFDCLDWLGRVFSSPVGPPQSGQRASDRNRSSLA